MKRIFLVALAFLAGSVRAELGRLNPAFEGIYDGKFTCRGSGCQNFPNVDRVMILDFGKDGIRISLHLSSQGLSHYNLNAVGLTGEGAHLEADALETMGLAVEWVSDIDRSTGRMTAHLRDTHYPGELTFSGKLVVSPVGQYKAQPTGQMFGLLDLQGHYAVSRQRTELVLRQPLNGAPELIGTWILSSGASVSFPDSEFLPEVGVLVLYGSTPYRSGLKWTVALSRDNQGAVRGDALACSNLNEGKCYPVKMVRTGP